MKSPTFGGVRIGLLAACAALAVSACAAIPGAAPDVSQGTPPPAATTTTVQSVVAAVPLTLAKSDTGAALLSATVGQTIIDLRATGAITTAQLPGAKKLNQDILDAALKVHDTVVKAGDVTAALATFNALVTQFQTTFKVTLPAPAS